MTDDAGKEKVSREPQPPEAGHGRDDPFARRISWCSHGVIEREDPESGGPAHVNNRGVANQ